MPAMWTDHSLFPPNEMVHRSGAEKSSGTIEDTFECVLVTCATTTESNCALLYSAVSVIGGTESGVSMVTTPGPCECEPTSDTPETASGSCTNSVHAWFGGAV